MQRFSLFLAMRVCAPIFLSGCAGIGGPYARPADPHQIPFTVEAITPALAARLAISPPGDAERPAKSEGEERFAYRIGPADVLSIFVNQLFFAASPTGPAGASAEHPGETLYVVSEEGKIFLPLVGPLNVGGLTVGEAYGAIASALARYISRPQLSVRVAEFRSQRIAVAGEVRTSGFIPITDRPISITEALIVAGYSDRADLRKVVLKRDGKDYPIDMFALIQSPTFGQDQILKHGDVLVVPPNLNKVFVLGEAPNRAQTIDPYSTTLAELLLGDEKSSASGKGAQNYLQSGTARPGSIFVIRGNTDSARVFHLNGSSPEAFILADQFQMANGDIVFVSTLGVTRVNRFIAQVLPSLSSLLAPLLVIDSFGSDSR